MTTARESRPSNLTGLIERAKEIAPLLEAEAPASESLGKLTDNSIQALRDGGFLELLGPAEFGGLDLGPYDAMLVNEEIFRADGAAGWVTMCQNVQLKPLTMMSYETVAKMYAEGSPGIGGQAAPTGTAEAVEGGYRITGNWQYGSGILHSNYAAGSCILVKDGQPVKNEFGGPTIVRFLAPIDQVEIKGNWDVLGLEASGSVDYGVKDLFVPDEFASATFILNAQVSDWVKNPSKLSFMLWVFWGHAVGELGMGRRLMEELKALAFKGAPNRGRLADDPVFLTEYAKADAAFQAARAWNYQVWRDIQESGERGEPTSTEHLTLGRAAMMHLQGVNVANAQFAFTEAGGASLRDGPLQRLYRNVQAAGQHIIMSRKIWSECGKAMIGNAEGMIWGPYALMPDPRLVAAKS
jgi:indole-3-acetate monooxygenase